MSITTVCDFCNKAILIDNVAYVITGIDSTRATVPVQISNSIVLHWDCIIGWRQSQGA